MSLRLQPPSSIRVFLCISIREHPGSAFDFSIMSALMNPLRDPRNNIGSGSLADMQHLGTTSLKY